jgi:hypothetical protein
MNVYHVQHNSTWTGKPTITNANAYQWVKYFRDSTKLEFRTGLLSFSKADQRTLKYYLLVLVRFGLTKGKVKLPNIKITKEIYLKHLMLPTVFLC